MGGYLPSPALAVPPYLLALVLIFTKTHFPSSPPGNSSFLPEREKRGKSSGNWVGFFSSHAGDLTESIFDFHL